MANEIILENGMRVPRDDARGVFHRQIEWCGVPLELVLVGDPDDSNARDALKYTADKLLAEPENWAAEMWMQLKRRLIPLLNARRDEDEEEIGDEDLDGLLFPIGLSVMHMGEVNLFKAEDNLVMMTYGVKPEMDEHGIPGLGDGLADALEDDSDNDPEGGGMPTYAIGGTLEEGFDEFYVNGKYVMESLEYGPVELCTGDVIEYDEWLEAYTGDIELLDEIVNCVFEMDEEEDSVDKSVALFEKVLEKIDTLDEMAMDALEKYIRGNPREIVKKCGGEVLSADEIIGGMYLDMIVFSPDGELDFSYLSEEAFEGYHVSVSGTFNMGFTRVSIEEMPDSEM